MGAGEALSAHERQQDEAAVNENGVLCTQKASGGESWVRRRPPVHTGAVREGHRSTWEREK